MPHLPRPWHVLRRWPAFIFTLLLTTGCSQKVVQPSLDEDVGVCPSRSFGFEHEREVADRSLLQHFLRPWQVLINVEEALESHMSQDPQGDFSSNVPQNRQVRAGQNTSLCWTPPIIDAGGYISAEDKDSMTYVPLGTSCPTACPYSQGLDDDQCFKACVTPEYCKALHPFRIFADEVSQLCTPSCGSKAEDIITGCMECESVGVCKRCSSMTVLSADGKECKDYWKAIWKAVYMAGVAAIVGSVLYLVYLQTRPVVAPHTLAYATGHREVCMPWRQTEMQRGQWTWEKLPLTTKSWEVEVSGIGTILYFRWMIFLICMGLFLFATLGITYNVALEDLSLNLARFDITDFHEYVDEVLSREVCPNATQRIPKDALDVVALQTGSSSIPNSNDTALALLEADAEADRPRIRSFRKISFRMKPKVRPRTNMGENRDPWELPAGTIDGFRNRMVVSNIIIYLVMCIASLEFSRRQMAYARDWDSSRPSHRQYAVKVKGLPPSATDAAELQRFFQECIDKHTAPSETLKVIGVSIAYDYYNSMGSVVNALQQITQSWSDAFDEQLDRTFGSDDAIPGSPYSSEVPTPSSKTPLSSMAKTADRAAELMQKYTKRSRDVQDPNMVSEEELEEIIQGAKCYGYAYVVMSSLQGKEILLDIADRIGLSYQGSKLIIKPSKADPHGVAWENFSSYFDGAHLYFRHASIIGFLMFIWVAVYVPYAVYNMLAVVVDGEMNHLQDTVLGALIAVGNALVTITIEMMAQQFGFREKDWRETVTMIGIFIAMTVNTAFDVWVVMIVLKGMAKSMAVYGTLDVMHYHRILAKELFMLIVPGYILTPYVICPVFEDWLPAWMERRRIRSTEGLSRAAAQVRYKYKDFDVTWRYSDILTNFTICIASIMFSTHHMYLMMLFVVLYLVLVLVLDQYRLVRQTSKTFIVTESLNEVFSYWWSIPTGFLGSITVHWWHETDSVRESLGGDAARFSGYIGMVAFMVVHVVLYCGLLRLLVNWMPTPPKHTVMYKDMCEVRLSEMDGATYFNTNPVHVLKTWLFPEAFPVGERNCMPYVQGKEHLQTAGADDAAALKTAALLRSRVQAIDAKTDYLKC
mmetsp:Transcript_36149/g.84718  ORF Transcript_36149/g.84718 Transcript_36149/m.84718 type:complete len:1096 (-) Transcript_36149:116-3403(-)